MAVAAAVVIGATTSVTSGVPAAADGPVPQAPTTPALGTAVPSAPRRAVLLGDSVLLGISVYGADREVLQPAGWDTPVWAFVGLSTLAGATLADQRREQLGTTVVVHLGNNDGGSPTVFESRVRTLVSTLRSAGVAHVLWLTLREAIPSNVGANEVLRRVAADEPALQLVPWNELGAAQPSWFARDHLHLTPAGARAMAAVVRDELERAYRRDHATEQCRTPAVVPVAPLGAASAVTAAWVLDSAGHVVSATGGPVFGDLAGQARVPAAIAGTPAGDGYWIADRAGGVAAFGAAPLLGDLAGVVLNAPVVALRATATGRGYWLVAADGGVFSFGDAVFAGSAGGLALRAPITDLAPTPSGRGYWLVAADGGVFSFGDAVFAGSAAGYGLATPAVGIAAGPTGGYRLLGADGGVFAYGGASFAGGVDSLGWCTAPRAVAVATTASGLGYWVLADDGRLLAFGDAAPLGSAVPVVAPRDDAVAAAMVVRPLTDPSGNAYRLRSTHRGGTGGWSGGRGAVGHGPA